MKVREVSPADRRAVKALTRLEREFMAGHPHFWSAPDADVRKQLSGRSAFFQDMEHTLFVAEHLPLFRSFRGRLGPLQILRLTRAARQRTRAGAIGGALLPEYRGRHIATMAAIFFRDLEEMGFKNALYYPVNHDNAASRGLAEAIGAQGRVLYHCFDKQLIWHDLDLDLVVDHDALTEQLVRPASRGRARRPDRGAGWILARAFVAPASAHRSRGRARAGGPTSAAQIRGAFSRSAAAFAAEQWPSRVADVPCRPFLSPRVGHSSQCGGAGPRASGKPIRAGGLLEAVPGLRAERKLAGSALEVLGG